MVTFVKRLTLWTLLNRRVLPRSLTVHRVKYQRNWKTLELDMHFRETLQQIRENSGKTEFYRILKPINSRSGGNGTLANSVDPRPDDTEWVFDQGLQCFLFESGTNLSKFDISSRSVINTEDKN